MTFDGNNLYVDTYGQIANSTGKIGVYNATTGAVENANLITGLSEPTDIAILAIPESSSLTLSFFSTVCGFSVWMLRRQLGSGMRGFGFVIAMPL